MYYMGVLFKETFIGHYLNRALVAHFFKVGGTHRYELRVQIVGKGLQKLLNIMLVDLFIVDLLLDRRGCKC